SRPDHADAYSNLALTLQERGRDGEAIAAYERALELQPDHADALNNAGFLLQEEGRGREAMELYRRSLEANPRFARAAYNLGLARRPERLLAADAARAHAMRAQLAPRGECLVGISWRSFQPRTRRLLERKKSAPLESFLAASRMANVKLVDLQYGDTASERAA